MPFLPHQQDGKGTHISTRPKPVKHILGFSGGIDSQATARWLLNRYPKDDVVLLNTDAGGNEHPLTVDFIGCYSATVHPVIKVQTIVADLWKTPGFAETKGLDSNTPLTFPLMAELKGRFPSRTAQFCTLHLKIVPTVRWIQEHYPDGNYIRYAGVRRDESTARKTTPIETHDDTFDCDLRHPIADWTKQMCFDFVRAHSEPINPLYTLGFNRVGCAPCINSGKEDIGRWADRFPEMIEKVRAWEQQVGRTFFPPCVPGKAINWIDEVVAWSRTKRGGKELLPILQRPACESKFGLCE